MTDTSSRTFSRWRTFLAQLWSAAGSGGRGSRGSCSWRPACFPSAVILASGSLVAAVPAAVEHGVASAAGRPALLALGALVLAMATATFAGLALSLVIAPSTPRTPSRCTAPGPA